MTAPNSGSFASLLDPGILRSALLPSLQLHTALAIPTYIIARSVNVVECKDLLWAGGQVANIWYASIGRSVFNDGVSVRLALRALSRPSKLLLAGVTIWGGRLFYRVLSRAYKRNFEDDPRYVECKTSSDWNWAPIRQYLPEALFQSVIALGYTFPFYAVGAKALIIPRDWAAGFEAAAIGIWTAGLFLEGTADWQIAHHKAQGGRGLCRDGVWSIVRHPNYLGDVLTHIAYPLLALSTQTFNPYMLLGPLANWYFLRHISGDKELEASQEERYRDDQPEKMLDLIESREEKNAFWPSVKEAANPWVWVVSAVGVAGVFGEKAFRRYYL